MRAKQRSPAISLCDTSPVGDVRLIDPGPAVRKVRTNGSALFAHRIYHSDEWLSTFFGDLSPFFPGLALLSFNKLLLSMSFSSCFCSYGITESDVHFFTALQNKPLLISTYKIEAIYLSVCSSTAIQLL